MSKFKNFASDQEEFLWYAFKGEFGKEFKGNPGLMGAIMEMERERDRAKETKVR